MYVGSSVIPAIEFRLGTPMGQYGLWQGKAKAGKGDGVKMVENSYLKRKGGRQGGVRAGLQMEALSLLARPRGLIGCSSIYSSFRLALFTGSCTTCMHGSLMARSVDGTATLWFVGCKA